MIALFLVGFGFLYAALLVACIVEAMRRTTERRARYKVHRRRPTWLH